MCSPSRAVRMTAAATSRPRMRECPCDGMELGANLAHRIPLRPSRSDPEYLAGLCRSGHGPADRLAERARPRHELGVGLSVLSRSDLDDGLQARADLAPRCQR